MLAITNGRLVTPGGIITDDLLVEGDKILGYGTAPHDADRYDAAGAFVMPGFIDAHTHLEMDLGTTVTADSFATGTAAALAGGTTTILDFATQNRGGTLSRALDAWHSRAAGNCSCDYGFHMAVTDIMGGALDELPEMLRRGVTSFKAYMAYDALRLSDDDLLKLLKKIGEHGGILGVHCELGDLVNSGAARELSRGNTSPVYHPLSRPPQVEALAVKKLLELAEKADTACWVVHLSTALGACEIRAARERGQRVLVETCPQYLALTDEVYSLPGFEGAKYVCSPPIREARDVAALWDALTGNEVDIISTDHCSFNFKGQKELGKDDFSKIPNGLPGIEHRAALIWSEGVAKGKIGAERFAALLSCNPARAFGMYPRKGTLLPGSDADIVIWDDTYSGILTAGEQVQNVDYSPWEGFSLSAHARAVFLRGELCAENGKVVRHNHGKYIARGFPESIR